MKLLYCSRDYTTHDLRFVRAFTAAGFDVAYVRLENDGIAYVREPLPLGARWVRWLGGGTPRPVVASVTDLLPDFRRVVELERPDIIHAGPVTSFGLLAAVAEVPSTILVSWGSDLLVDAHRDEWHVRATEAAVKHCAAFVCDNRTVLDVFSRIRGGVLPPHVCAPWGVERVPERSRAQSRSAARDSLGWNDKVVVVSTRAWHKEYRVPMLVDVFAGAITQEPRLRLLLLGDGEDRAEIERRVLGHGLGQCVHLPGMAGTDELHQWLGASDIYLSLVPHDGSSISLLEAMAFELPAVVPKNAGNGQWITNDKTGVLVAPNDAIAFSAALVSLARRADAKKMGLAARKLVERRANWEKTCRRLIELYGSVATNR